MSTLTVTTVTTANDSTDLTLRTGDGTGPQIIVPAAPGPANVTSNLHVTGTLAADANVSIGANVYANTISVRVGNSIVNVVIGNNTIYVGNSSANAVINSSGFFVGSATAVLTANANQTITGGTIITSLSLGTVSAGTLTLNMGDRPLQHYTANGAHTLAPGANTGSILLDIINGSGAGTITTSGWTHVSGEAFTTTSGHKFRCHCSVGQQGSLLVVEAMQ